MIKVKLSDTTIYGSVSFEFATTKKKNEKQMFAVQTRPASGGIIVVNPLKSSYIRWDDLSSSPFAVGGGEPVMMIKFSARRS